MISEINYKGHTAQPADYASEDGELSVSMGVIAEEGALKPILRPKKVMTFRRNAQGLNVLYVHETSIIKNFIFLKKGDGTALYYSDGNHVMVKSLYDFNSDSIVVHQMASVGNTLMALTDNGIHYFLWKGDTEGYRHLGTKIPELSLSFGLRGELITSETLKQEIRYFLATEEDAARYIGNPDYYLEIDEQRQQQGYTDYYRVYSTTDIEIQREAILGESNRLIAERVTKLGKFCFPFFVRYAYRLYDQSVTLPSAPVLMFASSPEHCAIWRKITQEYNKTSMKICGEFKEYTLNFNASVMDYCALDSDQIAKLREWGDIVNSVDIFVSAPIYNYDQDGKLYYSRTKKAPTGKPYFIGRKLTDAPSGSDETTIREYEGYYKRILNNEDVTFELSRDTDLVMNDVRNCSTFYLLKTIDLEDIATERTVLELEDGYLESLEVRESLVDSSFSHDQIMAKFGFSYNSRLHLGNIHRIMFEGFNIASLLPFANYSETGGNAPYRTIHAVIKKDGKKIIVDSGGGLIAVNDLIYVFYPDPDATAIEIYYGGAGSPGRILPLRRHDFLNGAYYYGLWENEGSIRAGHSSTASTIEERTVPLPNRIYTSLVNNPFVFPSSHVTSVGAGEVLALAVAKQALSPSQFGQFPLYAFTSEGVWAMTINSEGALNPAQPITSDVCTNPKGMSALDSSVMFPTARGLMLLSGSQTQCISDNINADNLFSVADLPKSEALFQIYKDTLGEDANGLKETKLLPFLDFIKGSSTLYDYVHQRVLLFNPDVSYIYVYSLKSNQWGMTSADSFQEVVPSSGASAYISITSSTESGWKSASIYDFSQSDGEPVTALVITRPFKLGLPFDFKTVNTVIQRGAVDRKAVKQVLYGTNDFRNWFVVWSSGDIYMRGFRGTPYKAYRLAVIATLEKEENLYGCTVQFERRLANQPR